MKERGMRIWSSVQLCWDSLNRFFCNFFIALHQQYFWSLNFRVSFILAFPNLTMCVRVIEDMKIEPRNKWRKAKIVKLNTSLDTSIYRDLMKNSWHKLDTFDLSSYANLEFSIENFNPWWLGLLEFRSLNS